MKLPCLSLRLLYLVIGCIVCASIAACAPRSLSWVATPAVVHAAIAETPLSAVSPRFDGGAQAAATGDPPEGPAPSPSDTPRPTLTRTPETFTATAPLPLPATSTPTPRLSPTATPCADSSGIVATVSISPTTLHYAMDARLYLPPCYAASDQRYPVLYLLHGLNNTENQWIELGVVTTTNKLIDAGAIAPLIIVMPRDRLDTRFDPAVVADLVPYVDRNYRTVADRQHRAIGGLSRGGAWAMHIGLHYPDLFGRIGAHSPAVFYGDETKINNWVWHLPAGLTPEVYIDIGANDSMIKSAKWLDQIFTWYKVDHTFKVQPGSHVAAYWSAHLPEYMRFYAAGWRDLPTPTPTSDWLSSPK